MEKILLVEDDLEFGELIIDFLGSKDIKVEMEEDPFKALVLNLNQFDLVLLDLGLPGIDGLEVCKEFRKKSKIPIMISSARGSVEDKVSGLQTGADDYLPKPYDPDELYARIVSLLRRTKDMEQEASRKDFEIDERSNDIIFRGNLLALTNAEYEVFKEIVKNGGNVVSKEQILYSSPSIESGDGKSLEVIISKIRQKIKHHCKDKHIVVIRGRGYRIVG